MKTLSKEDTAKLLQTCHRHQLRCRDTGDTEVIWELPGTEPWGERFIASGWFDAKSSSICSMQIAADKLGLKFSFKGQDAEELRYKGDPRMRNRTNAFLQPSQEEQERESLKRLAQWAKENGCEYNPATGGGLIIA